jgi:hypothetical protein
LRLNDIYTRISTDAPKCVERHYNVVHDNAPL